MKDRGFITFAQNTNAVDYVKLAYLQALSIKTSNKINSYAVLVDHSTMQQVTDRQREVFDYVIEIPGEDCAKYSQWKLQNEWKAQIATPFIETIKLEADMIVPTSIDHWWDILSNKDIVFTNKICDYREQISDTRVYRQVFDHNNLPDIYTGLYYFKNNDQVKKFFELAESIFENWHFVRTEILSNAMGIPSNTDLVFALAARIFGEENCTLPGAVPCFSHMKGAVQGWDINQIWMEYLYYQFDRTRFTVGFQRQRLPFHYHYKNFVTDEMIDNYERIYFG
jgi:hypothetical protein